MCPDFQAGVAAGIPAEILELDRGVGAFHRCTTALDRNGHVLKQYVVFPVVCNARELGAGAQSLIGKYQSLNIGKRVGTVSVDPSSNATVVCDGSA